MSERAHRRNEKVQRLINRRKRLFARLNRPFDKLLKRQLPKRDRSATARRSLRAEPPTAHVADTEHDSNESASSEDESSDSGEPEGGLGTESATEKVVDRREVDRLEKASQHREFIRELGVLVEEVSKWSSVRTVAEEERIGSFWIVLITAAERLYSTTTSSVAVSAIGCAKQLNHLTSIRLGPEAELKEALFEDNDSPATCLMPALEQALFARSACIASVEELRALEQSLPQGLLRQRLGFGADLSASAALVRASQQFQAFVGVRFKPPDDPSSRFWRACSPNTLALLRTDWALAVLTSLPAWQSEVSHAPELNERCRKVHTAVEAEALTQEVIQRERDRKRFTQEAKSLSGSLSGGAAVAAVQLAGVPSGRETRKCFYCKKTGHLMAKCFKRKQDRRSNRVNDASSTKRSWPIDTQPTSQQSIGHPQGGTPWFSSVSAINPALVLAAEVPSCDTLSMLSALIDTGSSATLVSSFVANHLLSCGAASVVSSSGDDHCSKRLFMADGSALPTDGIIQFELQFGEGESVVQWPVVARVVETPNLVADIIIGTDSMWGRADGLDVSISAGCVKFGERGDGLLIHPLGEINVAQHASAAAVVDASEETGGIEQIAMAALEELRLNERAEASSVRRDPPIEFSLDYSPSADSIDEWHPPIGPDRDAFRVVMEQVNTSDALSLEARTAIANSIERHKTVFGGLKKSGCATIPPCSRLEPMSIVLLNPTAEAVDKTLALKSIKLSEPERCYIQEEVEKMVAEGCLEDTKAPARAHAFVVAEKKPRLVVAMQGVNKISFALHFLLPRVDELRAEMSEFKVFASFDAWSFFYQIGLDKRSRPFTATDFAGRLLQFRRLPMGAKSCPAHAQRVFSQLLDKEVPGEFKVRVYIDDVLCGAVDDVALSKAIDWVLSQCALAGVTLSAPKSTVGVNQLIVLGAMVGYHDIRPTDVTLNALRDFGQPQTVRELRSFLGLFNQIGAHVARRVVSLLAPLQDLIKGAKGVSVAKLDWNEEADRAFVGVKDALSDITAIIPFDGDRPPFILTDASDVGVGAVLAHFDEHERHFDLVDAISHRFSPTEQRYSTPEKEGVAMCIAFVRWRHYILGRLTIVLCDNKPLVELLKNASCSPSIRFRNMASRSLGLNLLVVHAPGSLNTAADALSRDPLFCKQLETLSASEKKRSLRQLLSEEMKVSEFDRPLLVDCDGDETQKNVVSAVSTVNNVQEVPVVEKLRSPVIVLREQLSDSGAWLALEWLRDVAVAGQLDLVCDPSDPSVLSSVVIRLIRAQSNDVWTKRLLAEYSNDNDGDTDGDDDEPSVAVIAGVVFVRLECGSLRLALPDGLRNELVALAHGPSHRGPKATFEMLATVVYWPNMKQQVMDAARSCAQCQRVNAPRRLSFANLGDAEMGTTSDRFRAYEVDTFHLGPELGSRIACVVIERFSGWRAAMLLPNHSSAALLSAFYSLVVRPFGVPRLILCDGGKELFGDFADEMVRAGVKVERGLPGHHRLAARVERANRDLNGRLAHMWLAHGSVSITDDVAQKWLDIASNAANVTPVGSSSISPFELLFGRQQLISWSSFASDEISETLERGGDLQAADHVRIHRAALAALSDERALLRNQRRKAAEKAYADGRRPIAFFEAGDLVMVRAPERFQDGVNKNLKRLDFIGVFRVTHFDERHQNVTAKLLMPAPLYHELNGAEVGPIELDFELTVHVEDVRRFEEGISLDSSQLVSPLHVSSGFARDLERWNSPFFPSDNDEDSSELEVTQAISEHMRRLLTEEVSRRANARLKKAVQLLKRRHVAQREELNILRRRAQDPRCRAIDAAARGDDSREVSDAMHQSVQQQQQAPVVPELPRRLQQFHHPLIVEVLDVDVKSQKVLGLVKSDEKGIRLVQGQRVTRPLNELTRGERLLVERFLRARGQGGHRKNATFS